MIMIYNLLLFLFDVFETSSLLLSLSGLTFISKFVTGRNVHLNNKPI